MSEEEIVKVEDEKIEKRGRRKAAETDAGLTDLDRLVSGGDFGALNPEQRSTWVLGMCRNLGLNPASAPIKWLVTDGRVVPYFSRGATDQLRAIHNLSVKSIERGYFVGPDGKNTGVWVERVEVQGPDGRSTQEVGAVVIGSHDGKLLSPLDVANAVMKAATKASRRATVTHLGLGGLLVEDEIDQVPRSQPMAEPRTAPQRIIPAPRPAALPSGASESLQEPRSEQRTIPTPAQPQKPLQQAPKPPASLPRAIPPSQPVQTRPLPPVRPPVVVPNNKQ